MAEGGIKASPTKPGQEFLGNMGKAAEKLGIKIEEAMKIVSQEGNSPIKAALINFLISDTLKSAGTALQDWTGTPRDATEEFPYRRLMTGKGMTTSIDPRVIDVAPIAGSAASRVASGIRHLPTDIMRAATAAYGPQATASYIVNPEILKNIDKTVKNKSFENKIKQNWDLIDTDKNIAKKLGAEDRSRRQELIEEEGKKSEAAKNLDPSVGYRE